MNKLKLGLIATLILALSYILVIPKEKNTSMNELESVIEEDKCPINIELPKEFQSFNSAADTVLDGCYLLTDAFLSDFDKDNDEELFFQVSKHTCGTASCKTREVYIYDNEERVFHKEGYDTTIRTDDDSDEFEVVEQIKTWDEPVCCSSNNIVVRYKYSKDSPVFFNTIDTYIERGNLNRNE